MQTFLPHPNFVISAWVLDSPRLGKQRLECQQILRALQERSRSTWKRHPAVLMWESYEPALALYADCMVNEWVARGYNNSYPSARTAEGAAHWGFPEEWALAPVEMPSWLGHERFHASHRAALRHKAPEWYDGWDWLEAPVLDYTWPGRLPKPGDTYVEEATGRLWIVMERQGRTLRCNSDGEERHVPERDMRLPGWRRGQRID